MRPLELEVEGFRSYDRPVVFDWRGRHLVGIVGPIGSGKSSILDAIAFALYGKTPVFERESKTLINQQASALRVRFDFAIDDVVWRVLRVVRRTTGSQHALYRLGSVGLEASDAALGSIPVVEKERAVSARIEQLLGLDFAAFNRSVLLAQNRFARFLHAAPAERDRVLKGVFGFDRIDAMHQEAKSRRASLDTEVASLEGELAGLGADRQALVALKKDMVDAEAAFGVLEKASAAIAESTVKEQEAARALHRAGERLGAIDEVAVRLPNDRQVSAQQEAVTAAATARAEAKSDRGSVEERSRTAVADLAALTERIGTRAELARSRETLTSLGRAQTRLVDEKKTLEQARTGVSDADRRLRDSEAERTAARAEEATRAKDAESAKVTRRNAEQALRRAERGAMAASLARELAVGEPCPVCGRDVDHPPHVADDDAGDSSTVDAESALEKARKHEDETRNRAAAAMGKAAAAAEAVSGATRGREAAQKSLTAAQERVRKVEAEISSLEVELTDRLGLGDPEERLDAIESQLTAAEKAVEAAKQEMATAESALEDARQAESEAKASASRLAHRLANLAGSLGAGALGTDLESALDRAAEPAGLAALAEQVRRAMTEAQAAAEADRGAAEAARAEAQKERRTRIEALGLDADTDVDAALAEARRTRDRKHDEIARLEKALARSDALRARLETARVELRRYRQLAEDLTAPRFLRFLLDEERALLADLGSARFEMLSGGRYRFTDDGTFDVVDLANAEAVRKAETLSGGETFLASLALALALAETVTGGGGRLDAFFLDEGFGALDEEHLDLAMDGIERLVADSPRRMVSIVSHVPELRQRVDDLIVLDKDPITGASRVVRGAAPG